jgi:hypothetical protein
MIIRPIAAVFAALISCLVLIGCRTDNRPMPTRTLIVAVDVSCRVPALLDRYGSLLYQAQRRLRLSDRLIVYRFANSAEPIYEGEPLTGRHNFNDRLGLLLRSSDADPALTTKGTRIDRLWAALTSAVDRQQSRTRALILTDGGVEDQSAASETTTLEAVRRLGAIPSLERLAVIGVEPVYRTQWLGWLVPLGSRAAVRGQSDTTDIAAWLTGAISGGDR